MTHFSSILGQTEFPANILCIDQFTNIGGGQQSLLDMLPAFSARRWRPSVAVPGDGPLLTALKNRGYRSHRFAYGSYASRRKPLQQLFRYGRELPKLVRYFTELVQAHEIDLLYVNGPRLVPPAAWVAWRRGIPLVFHCHNRLLQQSAITITGQALELASAHVIACCNCVADPLREYVAPERLKIVYNGVGEMPFSGLQPSQKMSRIGVVGRVEPEKGQMQFVQAVRTIAQQLPQCRFSIIGTPMFSGLDYYRKIVASSQGLPIDFAGWQEDIAQIYSGLDLLVVPSTALEATTRVILEAFSAGVPVVAFPVGGIPEVIQDEQTGFLTKATTADALAQRILSVVRMDRSRVHAVVRNARKEWRRRFTLRQYRDDVCGVMNQAMQPTFDRSYEELHATAGI